MIAAIDEFGPEEHDALCASPPITVKLPKLAEVTEPVAAGLASLIGRLRATPRLDALNLLAEQHAQLSISAKRETRDASNERALVRRVGRGRVASTYP